MLTHKAHVKFQLNETLISMQCFNIVLHMLLWRDGDVNFPE